MIDDQEKIGISISKKYTENLVSVLKEEIKVRLRELLEFLRTQDSIDIMTILTIITDVDMQTSNNLVQHSLECINRSFDTDPEIRRDMFESYKELILKTFESYENG